MSGALYDTGLLTAKEGAGVLAPYMPGRDPTRPTEKERDDLIDRHMPLVRSIAGKLKRALPRTLEEEDLIAYGCKGLVEAAQRFDASQGVSFSTFAYYRVRGAMLDGLRTMGWYSRADYARYRAEERANELLRAHAERDGAREPLDKAGDKENASPGETLTDIAQVLNQVAAIHIISLEAAASVVDERLPPPDEDLDRLRIAARLRAAVDRLPEKERQLMVLYYFEDKTLEESGSALGLSKSWACRLHARAVAMLRADLPPDEGD